MPSNAEASGSPVVEVALGSREASLLKISSPNWFFCRREIRSIWKPALKL